MARHLEVGPIVVGVDGSESALRAARWAAVTAHRRGVGLRLVHAFELPFRTTSGALEEQGIRDIVRAQGTRWLAGTRQAVADRVPDLPVEFVSADSSAAELLIKESATASLVVLGTRGLGGFTGLLIGPTAIAVAGRARCPMVVIRGAGEVPAEGPVVVGVDARTSESAVAFAFAEAALRGADLVAVHSTTEDHDSPVDEATRTFAERLSGYEEKYTDVQVTRMVVDDSPARVLLAHAATAQLVVVGTRGRGGFRGLVLGSTSQQLLHHSPCPVAVVRADHG